MPFLNVKKVKKILNRGQRKRMATVKTESMECYQHCTPLDAVALSKDDEAWGYDLLRWGEEYHIKGEGQGFVAARANKAGLWILFKGSLERDFINDRTLNPDISWRRRTEYINAKNFHPWGTITGANYDFIMSLLWVPSEPVSPLEQLALQAE